MGIDRAGMKIKKVVQELFAMLTLIFYFLRALYRCPVTRHTSHTHFIITMVYNNDANSYVL